MRKPIRLALCLTIFACASGAQPSPATTPVQSSPENAATTPNPAFEKIKTLVGEWEFILPTGGRMVNTFQIIGTGSAVLQTESRPDREKVVTLFYPVGAELRADHYCFLKNQPRFVAKSGPDPNVISFEMRDITNLESSREGRHMHATEWHFIDARHLTQEWHLYQNGKEAKVSRLEFTRVN